MDSRRHPYRVPPTALDELLHDAGLSDRALQRRCGIAPATLRRTRRGASRPARHVMQRLAATLNVPVSVVERACEATIAAARGQS